MGSAVCQPSTFLSRWPKDFRGSFDSVTHLLIPFAVFLISTLHLGLFNNSKFYPRFSPWSNVTSENSNNHLYKKSLSLFDWRLIKPEVNLILLQLKLFYLWTIHQLTSPALLCNVSVCVSPFWLYLKQSFQSLFYKTNPFVFCNSQRLRLTSDHTPHNNHSEFLKGCNLEPNFAHFYLVCALILCHCFSTWTLLFTCKYTGIVKQT